MVYQIWPPPPYASESCEYASGECASDSAGPAARSGSWWWWWWWADMIGSDIIGACEMMVLCTGCTTGVIRALCPWITLESRGEKIVSESFWISYLFSNMSIECQYLDEYADTPAGTLDMTDPTCSSKM